MKILKCSQYIKEELTETPETYISTALNQLKRKLDKLFDEVDLDDKDKVLSPEQLDKKDSKKMSFKDLGVQLDSSEVSKHSRLYDTLTIKFTDDKYTYTFIVMIDVKEAMPDKDQDDFDFEDIKNAYIKFKKYDLDTFEIIGQITKNVELKDINETMIINLKIELDNKFDVGGEEEFEIESE